DESNGTISFASRKIAAASGCDVSIMPVIPSRVRDPLRNLKGHFLGIPRSEPDWHFFAGVWFSPVRRTASHQFFVEVAPAAVGNGEFPDRSESSSDPAQ